MRGNIQDLESTNALYAKGNFSTKIHCCIIEKLNMAINYDYIQLLLMTNLIYPPCGIKPYGPQLKETINAQSA